RAVVTAEDKRAAGSKDILKGQSVIIANLQHPPVEPILKIEIVAEGYLHRAAIADKNNGWRKKLIVAECGGVIYESCIGWGISRWRGHSGMRRDPGCARTTARQRRWRHAVEKLREK